MQEIVHSRFALFTMGTDDIKKDYVFFKSYVRSKRLNLWLDRFFRGKKHLILAFGSIYIYFYSTLKLLSIQEPLIKIRE